MKKLKKALVLALATLLVVGCFAGCGNSGAGNDEASGKFLIGGIGPLTGDAASYGISVKQGAEIAIDEINAAGGANGLTLELLFEDDVNDAEKAVSAYNKLMDEDIRALVGTVTTTPCIAVADESVNDGILQITPSGSGLECTKNPNGFRICFTDPLQGKTMANYILEQGITKAALIYDIADEYSKGITEAFVAEYQANGGEIVAQESFTGGDVDFKTQLTKVKASGAECLFLPIYYTEVGYITEQAKSVGLELPYFGCDGWDGVIKQLDGDTSAINGATFLTPFVANAEDELTKNFVASYEAKYGATPDQFAADAYDAIYAIKAAIEKVGSDAPTNEELVQAMTEIEVIGLTGNMTFTADGEPNKSAKVAIIQDGQYIAK